MMPTATEMRMTVSPRGFEAILLVINELQTLCLDEDESHEGSQFIQSFRISWQCGDGVSAEAYAVSTHERISIRPLSL